MINLYHLYVNTKEKAGEVLDAYLDEHGITLKDHEIRTLNSFIELFKNNSADLTINLDGFHIGYIIPQVSKEFDLLRITKERVLNIELKSRSTLDKIQKQQSRNYFYLQSLNLEISIFTYVENENRIYKYDNGKSVKVSFDEFWSELIKSSNEAPCNNIANLSKPKST